MHGFVGGVDTNKPAKIAVGQKGAINPRNLAVRDPERYEAVVTSLKEGNSLTQTAVECGVARNTVDRIKHENKDQLTEWKWRNYNKLGKIIAKGLDRLDSEFDSVHINSVALQIGILLDKRSMIEGELVGKAPEKQVILHGDFNKLLDQVKSGNLDAGSLDNAKTPIKSGVIDVEGKDQVGKSGVEGGGGGANPISAE